MMQRVRALAVLTLVVTGLTVASASAPRFWQVSTQAAFLKGEVEGLSIDTDGRLLIGPVVHVLYEASVPFIWTVATSPDGTTYAGSGNDGQVFRIDRQGKVSVFADMPEMEVHAIAFSSGGLLYVATSPDGKIYKVDKNGAPVVFFDPDDKYIWALAVDAKGRVYAATGDKGLIYRVTPDGKGEVFYKTKATHVTSLAFDRDGRLLAGTESPGRAAADRRGGQGVRPPGFSVSRDRTPYASRRTVTSTRPPSTGSRAPRLPRSLRRASLPGRPRPSRRCPPRSPRSRSSKRPSRPAPSREAPAATSTRPLQRAPCTGWTGTGRGRSSGNPARIFRTTSWRKAQVLCSSARATREDLPGVG